MDAPSPPLPAPDQAMDAASRRYLRPTAMGWGFLVIAAFSGLLWLISGPRPQLAIAIALLVASVLDAGLARWALGGLTLRLTGPENAAVREPSEWQVRIDGIRRPVSVRPAMHPRPPPFSIDHETTGRVTMAGFGVGVVWFLVFDLHAHGPIGLFEAARRVQVAPTRPVFVGPPPVAVEVDWPRPRAVGFGLTETAPLGDDLFRSIRPYVRGDEQRRVHWKATARHGHLMVRESDGTGVVALQVVLEVLRPGPTAEVAAGVAAWLTAEALAKGWLVELVTLDAAPPPRQLLQLGTPFGVGPTFAAGGSVPLQLCSQRVRSMTDVNRQLSTAGCGEVLRPTWSGMTCVVSEAGLTWP